MSKTYRQRVHYIHSIQQLDHLGITKGIGGSKTRGQVLESELT